MVLKVHKYFTVIVLSVVHFWELFIVHFWKLFNVSVANFQQAFNRGIIGGKTIGWGLLKALLLYNNNMSVLLPQMTISSTLFTKEGGNIGI